MNKRGNINLGGSTNGSRQGGPRFNAPPGWPAPPAEWVPPAGWQPEAAWPAAPKGWKFWVDANGKPVAGPAGAYGATSNRSRLLGCGCLTVAGLVLFGSCMAALGSKEDVNPSPVVNSTTSSTSRPPAPTATTPASTPVTVTATTTVAVPAEAPAAPAPTTSRLTVQSQSKTASTQGPRLVEQPTARTSQTPKRVEQPAHPAGAYFANCSQAKAAGAAPLRAGDPGYSRKLDRDGDGVACEK